MSFRCSQRPTGNSQAELRETCRTTANPTRCFARCAMAMKRTRKLPISNEPSDPVEAAKWLAKLCQQLEDHIDEYKFEADQTGVSFELVRWFVAAVKAAEKDGGSLERALGLRRGKGRPKETGPGKHFQLVGQVFFLKSRGKSWKTVCDELEFSDQRELQKIYKRELPKVLRAYADKIVNRLKRRDRRRLKRRKRRDRRRLKRRGVK